MSKTSVSQHLLEEIAFWKKEKEIHRSRVADLCNERERLRGLLREAIPAVGHELAKRIEAALTEAA